jgi:agmatine/peptidylarginine deiminase
MLPGAWPPEGGASMQRLIIAALVAGLSSAATAASAQSRHTDSAVLQQKEASLPDGALPAWQSGAERALTPAAAIPDIQGPVPAPPVAGYRVPAEFEPVSAFMVTQGDWESWGDPQMLIDMIVEGTAADGAPAIVLTDDTVTGYEAYLEGEGVDMTRVHVVEPTAGLNARWARDFGPISIYEGGVDGHLAFGDLHYYDSRPADDDVPNYLAAQLGFNRYGVEGVDHTPDDDVELRMEGGNFQTDGNGTCILSNDIATDNDDAGNTDADTLPEVEDILAAYLGCEQIVWLTPPPNTGTGHVDMYTKLLTPTDILMIDFPTSSPSSQTTQADAIVEANVDIMEAALNMDGDPFVVHRVTIPGLTYAWDYATYTNSVMLNRVVLVPTYGSTTYDGPGLAAYETILGSDYTIVGIDSTAIYSAGGSVHCTTMQISSACGNEQIDDLLFEECDGEDLDDQTCATLGLGTGALTCTSPGCQFDTSACSDADTDTDTDSDTDTDTDTDSDTDTDTDTDSDSDTDTDTDADTDTEVLTPGSANGGCGCAATGRATSPASLLGRLF